MVLTGKKLATLDNLSTMTQIESFPLLEVGSPVIKSIPTESHFHSGICSCGSLMSRLDSLTYITLGDIAKCDICQRVKSGHQRHAGLLQPLQILEWKWDSVGMDFIIGLPTSSRGNDSIWVIVDRLSKFTHFLPVKTTYQSSKLAELYVARIHSLRGVPRTLCRIEELSLPRDFGRKSNKD